MILIEGIKTSYGNIGVQANSTADLESVPIDYLRDILDFSIARTVMRGRKDYKSADVLRDCLLIMGVSYSDKSDMTEYKFGGTPLNPFIKWGLFTSPVNGVLD